MLTAHLRTRYPGKTTFLAFVLAQLLLAKQVVLLIFPNHLLLFYSGKVYRREGSGIDTIPKYRQYWCTWALINSDSRKEGPPLDTGFSIWPVQASSPKPSRWTAWLNQFGGVLSGMPLWKIHELNDGYVVFCFPRSRVVCREYSLTLLVLCPSLRLHSSFHDFQERLEQSLNPTGPITNVRVDIKYAMKVLCEHAESHGGQVLRMDVGRALNILVEHAVGEFGFAPRDVYRAVFVPDHLEKVHAAAMGQLSYSTLEICVSQFRVNDPDSDSLSHKVITVDPIQSGLFQFTDVDWEMTFKSSQIARGAKERLQREKMHHLRQIYNLFKGFPHGDSMAGCIFEAMVHRKIHNGWQQSDNSPQYIPMRTHPDKKPEGPPTFSTDPVDGTDRSPRPAPLSPNGKESIIVDLARTCPPEDVTLDEHRYYRPSSDKFSLFDCFTVHHDGGSTFVITIIQITILGWGSGEGYKHIRKIMERVKKLAKEKHSDPKVQVVYCLICPEGNIRHVWTMPDGWTENIGDYDHRGEAFYLRVPFSCTLCLSAPIFTPAELWLCIVFVQSDKGDSEETQSHEEGRPTKKLRTG